MFIVTAQEMRELDRLTIQKYGVPSLVLMERAGKGVERALAAWWGKAARGGVLIVAGKGNNGGDGLVVARLLKKKGFPARSSCSPAKGRSPRMRRINCAPISR